MVFSFSSYSHPCSHGFVPRTRALFTRMGCCSSAAKPEETFDSISGSGDEFSAMRLQLSNIGKQQESTTAATAPTRATAVANAPPVSPRSPDWRPKALTPRLFKDRLDPVQREMARRNSSKASEIGAAMRRPSELKDEPTEDPANDEAPIVAPAEAPAGEAPAGEAPADALAGVAAAASAPAEAEVHVTPPAASFSIDQISDAPP